MSATRSPLLRFFVLGALLLLVYGLAGDSLGGASGKRIDIGEDEVALMADNFERTWRRPPTASELRGLIDARVREEVLYREALALGLDADDVVVRRRMVQKMELLTQDLAVMSDPTDDQLRRFLADNRERYRSPDRISFTQVFFSVDRRGAAAESDAVALLARLEAGTVGVGDAEELGDSSLLAPEYRAVTPADVERTFGADFAAALFALGEGWHGPLQSAFGYHVVRISERVAGADPDFATVRSDLIRDLNRERRNAATERLYDGLLSEYEVTIDEAAVDRMSLEATRGGR
ncbi:MAG: peptidylprolyl isomerase [Acidobacteriota bacterium]|jgi:hypothetical protein